MKVFISGATGVMSFLTAIWLLPIALALHEAEEWNILGWEQRNFVNLPAKTNASVRTFLVFSPCSAFSGPLSPPCPITRG